MGLNLGPILFNFILMIWMVGQSVPSVPEYLMLG